MHDPYAHEAYAEGTQAHDPYPDPYDPHPSDGGLHFGEAYSGPVVAHCPERHCGIVRSSDEYAYCAWGHERYPRP
ncbi:hypothetical protein [Streptomyces sp. NPDC004050]